MFRNTVSIEVFQPNIFLTVPNREIFKAYFLRRLCIHCGWLVGFVAFSFLQLSMQKGFVALAL